MPLILALYNILVFNRKSLKIAMTRRQKSLSVRYVTKNSRMNGFAKFMNDSTAAIELARVKTSKNHSKKEAVLIYIFF